MKKKILMILLTIATVSSGITVTAQDISIGKGSRDIDVQGKYQDNSIEEKVYSVDISWEEMKFVFSKNGNKTWNPTDHTYTDNTNKTWEKNGNSIRVTNHSNTDVTIDFSFVPLETYDTVNGTFDISSKTLKSGVLNQYDMADNVTSKLTLAGELEDTDQVFQKIGTVSVKIQ